MADDIEAFLRRAAQRRKEQAARKAAPAAKSRPEYTDSRAERTIRQVRPEEVVVEAEIVDDSAGISDLSSRHLQADHLANTVGQADDKMEAHIQKVFDHQVGRLASEPSEPVIHSVVDDDIAKTLISLLQTPQGVQQAFLLREIIDRPEHRWD
ncbi:hypothetical protein EC9_39850 [Rosistilla ulvae]|uniref:Uncharacterized protein n=1 Tax=Rosistilla ulvae TaxID=1930277 RepID=A0A517M4J3_9BACT|nr:hypothetical protein [Rosistilla ulvae]QDS89785.1 hypothetical protein EC9_39850 [Rosistilla ulvae]